MDLKMNFETRALELVDGDLALTDGLDTIEQELRIRLLTWFGEWFLDESEGIPYIEEFFEKFTDTSIISAILQLQILLVEGVIEIQDFSIALDTRARELSVEAAILTTDGAVVISEVI